MEKTIEKKISALTTVENDIPGVIIIHDIRDASVVYMSKRGLEQLNVTLDDLKKLGPDYNEQFFNPEDARDYVPKIMGLIERNNNDESISYFQQVRLSAQADWVWHASSTRIFFRNDNGQPLLTITISIPIDASHHLSNKVERLLQENTFLKKYKDVFSGLTNREKEVLKLMAMGCNSSEIADRLFISESTASTHRRNIKSKLNAKNNYDITLFAQAFDLI